MHPTQERVGCAAQVDEPDYDARLGAYAELVPAAWARLGAARALPLLHHCLADLRRPDDLALRHAASQALSRLVTAAAGADAGAAGSGQAAGAALEQALPALAVESATAVQTGAAAMEAGAAVRDSAGSPGGKGAGAGEGASGHGEESGAAAAGLPELAQRVLFAQLKRTVAASSLAVRQVRCGNLSGCNVPQSSLF